MDWQQFLDDNSIDYVTRGPNTKRGEVSVQCPWCGEDDPSHHLGISLGSENWGCHRSMDHRGRSASWLIAALLGCSHTQAKLVAAQYSAPDPETLDEALALLTGMGEAPKPSKGQPGPLRLPDEFRPIRRRGLESRFWNYLQNRGFDDVEHLAARYGLKCANSGRWKDRVILPVYQDRTLIDWTGRAIGKTIDAPRYLSYSEAIKTTVFNEDELRHEGGDILLIVEGPIDALKLDFYSFSRGVRATCIFGTSMTIDQMSLLTELSRHFRQAYVLFDPEALESSFGAKDWILGRNVVIGQIPEGIEDPGAMSKRQVLAFIEGLKENKHIL